VVLKTLDTACLRRIRGDQDIGQVLVTEQYIHLALRIFRIGAA